ncbi:RNA polymerase sigma factor [bacterium]|nr:RNA polymerase sigma factor [bacterium]
MNSTAPPSQEDAARQSAFLSLLDEHYPAFERYVRGMTRDQDDAGDLIGETLLRAYQAFDTVRDQSSFRFYLITIAKRLHWLMAKRRTLHLPFERKHEELRFETAESIELSADMEALYAAIAKLPPKLRETLVLYELSGLSLKEIRTMQGGSMSGVKSRLVRARKQLALLLGVPEHEDSSQTGNAQPAKERIEVEQ